MMKETENNFDLIRLFAAAEVALKHVLLEHYHATEEGMWFLSSIPGVPVFFFISGYLIFKSFFHTKDLATFATNRALRIYPALVCCFIISFCFVFASGYLSPFFILNEQFWIYAAAQMSVLQIYNAPFLRGFGTGALNGSLWTIGVELQFYLLTPLLFYVTRNRKWTWPVLFVVFVCANLLMRYLGEDSFIGKVYSLESPPWFFMFVFGAWLFVKREWLDWIKVTNILIFIVLYAGATVIGLLLGWRVGANWINPLSFVALALLIMKLAYTAPWLSGRLLRQNDISYGIYIYHMPFSNLLLFYGLVGSIWYAVLAMSGAILFSIASWLLIERPALHLKQSTLRRY